MYGEPPPLKSLIVSQELNLQRVWGHPRAQTLHLVDFASAKRDAMTAALLAPGLIFRPMVPTPHEEADLAGILGHLPESHLPQTGSFVDDLIRTARAKASVERAEACVVASEGRSSEVDDDKMLAIALFDVFVSHSTEDKPYVEPLVKALESAGIRVWYDKSALEWGDDLRSAIDRGLSNCRCTKSQEIVTRRLS